MLYNSSRIKQGAIKITKKLKSLLIQAVNLKDCPYRLAKSIALGFGLALLPLPGLNIPVGIILAKLLKLNIIATTIPALLLTYVSPLLYVFNYKIGSLFIISSETVPSGVQYDLSFGDKIINFFAYAGPAYLLGSFINASLAAVVSYFVFLVIYKNSNKILKKDNSKPEKITKQSQES